MSPTPHSLTLFCCLLPHRITFYEYLATFFPLANARDMKVRILTLKGHFRKVLHRAECLAFVFLAW